MHDPDLDDVPLCESCGCPVHGFGPDYRLAVLCPDCARLCPKCRGAGEVTYYRPPEPGVHTTFPDLRVAPCPDCQGTGRRAPDPTAGD